MKIVREKQKFVVKEGPSGPYIAIEPLDGQSRVLYLFLPAGATIVHAETVARQLNDWDLALGFEG